MYKTTIYQPQFFVAIKHPGHCYPEIVGFYYSLHHALRHYERAEWDFPKSEIIVGMR